MGAHLGHMELMGLKGPLGDVVDPLRDRPILGDVDVKFDPVRILMVAQLFQVLVVIGRVVIGEKQAPPVIAFHQHAFPVQVGKAQRPMHLIAALFPGKVLYCLEQGGGDLRIVDEIHLGKAHTAGVPFFIGPVAEDGADAANDFPVPVSQEALGVAVGKGGIRLGVPIAQIVPIGGGDEIGIIFIQLVRKVYKAPAIGLAFHPFYGDHALQ